MARILSADQERSIDQLCNTFTSFDRDLIQSVAENCDFDINETYRVLDDMAAKQESEDWSPPNYTYNDYASSPSSQQSSYDKIIGFIHSGYKILIFIRGLPGSGKTSLATNILEDTLGQAANRSNHIFTTRNHIAITSITSIQRDAREENQRQCFWSIKKGVSPIIIDDTNLELEDMRVYSVMAVEYNYMIEIITPSTSWALNPRILATKNSDRLSEMKIREMLQRYDQSLCVGDLFRRFSLNYVGKMPQFRKDPPFLNSGGDSYVSEPISTTPVLPPATGFEDGYAHQAKLFVEQLGGDKDLMRKVMLLLGSEFTQQELQGIITELQKKARGTWSRVNLAPPTASYGGLLNQPQFGGHARGKRCGRRYM